MTNAQTKSTTVNAVMRSAAFKHGVMDGALGEPMFEYRDGQDAWRYERGRQFAVAAKVVQIKHKGGMVAPELRTAYQKLRADGTIR